MGKPALAVEACQLKTAKKLTRTGLTPSGLWDARLYYADTEARRIDTRDSIVSRKGPSKT